MKVANKFFLFLSGLLFISVFNLNGMKRKRKKRKENPKKEIVVSKRSKKKESNLSDNSKYILSNGIWIYNTGPYKGKCVRKPSILKELEKESQALQLQLSRELQDDIEFRSSEDDSSSSQEEDESLLDNDIEMEDASDDEVEDEIEYYSSSSSEEDVFDQIEEEGSRNTRSNRSYNIRDYRKARSGRKNLNLRGANLRGADLSGVNLEGADFTDADLRETIFNDAKLNNAKFVCVDCTGAFFNNAELNDVLICGIEINNQKEFEILMKQRVFAPNELLHDEIVSKKSYTSFRNAKLNNSKLNNAFIIGADFSNAKLNHAKLNEVFVYSSKFIDAKLKHAQGEKPHFELVDFSKANLKHAELKGLTVIGFKGRDINKVFKKKQFKSSFRGAKMQDVVLDKSMIMGVDFSDANLKNATFNGEETNEERSRLIGVIFNGEAKLNNSEFNNAILTCVDFSDAKLEGAKFNKIKADGQIKFHNADLTESEFNGARLLDVDFSDANLEGAELKEIYGIFLKFSKVTNVGKELGTNLRNTVFNGSEIENSNFTWSNLEETYLDNVTFKNVDFSKAVFKRNKFTGTKFYDSTLEESDLSDLHFNQVIINNTSFLRAKINNVSFFESTLVKIDMKEIIASELIFDSMKLMWNLNFSHARIKYFCIESSDILGYFLNFTDALLEEAFFLGTAYRHKKRLANGWKTVITGGKLFFPSFDNSRLSGVYIANTAIFGENGLNHSLPYGGVCLNRCFFLGWDKPNTLKINESYSDYYFTKDDDFKKLLSGGRLSSELKSLHKIFVQIMLSQKNIKVNEDIPKSFEHKWPHHPGMAERLLERFLGKVVDAIPI